MKRYFTRFAHIAANIAGRTYALIACLALVLTWAVSGPLFGFSAAWQLMINTMATIVTFLVVALIQHAQTRDNAILQAKLDELIRVSEAENSFVGMEHLNYEQLEAIIEACERRASKLRGDRKQGALDAATAQEKADADGAAAHA